MATMMTAPATMTREQAFTELDSANRFLTRCEKDGTDSRMARVKFNEAERAFELATGRLEHRMYTLTVQLAKTAKFLAYKGLIPAVLGKIEMIQFYQSQGYRSPLVDRPLEFALSAIQQGDAFRAMHFASRSLELYEALVNDLTESKRRTENRSALASIRTEAKRRAVTNSARRAEENRTRAKAYGAGTKNGGGRH